MRTYQQEKRLERAKRCLESSPNTKLDALAWLGDDAELSATELARACCDPSDEMAGVGSASDLTVEC